MAQNLSDLTAANVLADVSPQFFAFLANKPLFSWMLPMEAARTGDSTMKFEWMEQARSEISSALNLTYTAASLAITVVSDTNYQIGDQVHIEGHVDTDDLDIIYRVSAKPGGNILTVVLLQGTDTTFALATPPQNVHRQQPQADGVSGESQNTLEPSSVSNYLQLIQQGWELGFKAMRVPEQGDYKGITSLVDLANEQTFERLAFQLYRAVMRGFGQGETGATSSTAASMQGILNFVNTASDANRVDAAGAPVDEDDVNDLIKLLSKNGLPPGEELIMLMSPDNSVSFSAIRNTANATALVYTTESREFGGDVQVYNSLLGGYKTRIIVDNNLPNGKIYLLSSSNVNLVPSSRYNNLLESATIRPPVTIDMPMLPVWAVDSTANGDHSKKLTYRTEGSVMVKHALTHHGVIKNVVPA